MVKKVLIDTFRAQRERERDKVREKVSKRKRERRRERYEPGHKDVSVVAPVG